MPDLSAAAAALSGLSGTLSASGQYAAIRDGFISNLTNDVTEFLGGDPAGSTRPAVNAAKRSVTEAYGAAADAASGGPLDPEDLAFFNSEVSAEMDFVESFFGDLKLQRAAGDLTVPGDRIEMFARSMDAMFNELNMRAQSNLMLTMDGDDGAESCRDCQRLKGQRHRASWWTSKGLIPAVPGNENYSCKGYLCQHFLADDQGNRFSV